MISCTVSNQIRGENNVKAEYLGLIFIMLLSFRGKLKEYPFPLNLLGCCGLALDAQTTSDPENGVRRSVRAGECGMCLSLLIYLISDYFILLNFLVSVFLVWHVVLSHLGQER